MSKLRVLIACEYSGTLRDAFGRLGVEAWSCDLLPTESPGLHYQGSVFDILLDHWDLLIAHPPCQFLSFAGNRWLNVPGRKESAADAMQFFLKLWQCQVKHVCIENPVGIPNQVIGKPTQIIHPYQFGDPEYKRTCLWLRNLPKLEHCEQNLLWAKQTHVSKPDPVYRRSTTGKPIYFTEANHGSKDRSKTFPGFARCAAEQWTEYLQKMRVA